MRDRGMTIRQPVRGVLSYLSFTLDNESIRLSGHEAVRHDVMAVYTTLTHHEILDFLLRFNLPDLQHFEGANTGIENTTYFLTLADGNDYVLSIFEHLGPDELHSFLNLFALLARHKLPVPYPIVDKSGTALQALAHKPALLFNRAPGNHIVNPSGQHCRQIGHFLGVMHKVTSSQTVSKPSLPNCGGSALMQETFSLVRTALSTPDQQLLMSAVHLSKDLEARNLPASVTHGDLFRDNALFAGDELTAVIDFYSASNDISLLDLAITVNDWCYGAGSTAPELLVESVLQAYQSQRPLTNNEKNAWQECLQVAAARLWLSRQKRVLFAPAKGIQALKDPLEYRSRLLFHKQGSNTLLK